MWQGDIAHIDLPFLLIVTVITTCEKNVSHKIVENFALLEYS